MKENGNLTKVFYIVGDCTVVDGLILKKSGDVSWLLTIVYVLDGMLTPWGPNSE